MQIYISLVIGDASAEGIRTTVATDPEVIRVDLLEFYNDAVNDGGLRDTAIEIHPDTDLEEVISWIEAEIGRTVVIQESDLIQP